LSGAEPGVLPIAVELDLMKPLGTSGAFFPSASCGLIQVGMVQQV